MRKCGRERERDEIWREISEGHLVFARRAPFRSSELKGARAYRNRKLAAGKSYIFALNIISDGLQWASLSRQLILDLRRTVIPHGCCEVMVQNELDLARGAKYLYTSSSFPFPPFYPFLAFFPAFPFFKFGAPSPALNTCPSATLTPICTPISSSALIYSLGLFRHHSSNTSPTKPCFARSQRTECESELSRASEA